MTRGHMFQELLHIGARWADRARTTTVTAKDIQELADDLTSYTNLRRNALMNGLLLAEADAAIRRMVGAE